MTDYTTLADADLAQDKPVTQAKARALRDNPLAIAEGATGAPKIQHDALFEFSAGDYILARSDDDASTTSTSYTKVKEIVAARAGTFRIKFNLTAFQDGGSNHGYGKIYVNGIAVGTERHVNFGANTQFSEDISGIAKGDLVQVYAHITSATSATVSNFHICASEPWDFIVNL